MVKTLRVKDSRFVKELNTNKTIHKNESIVNTYLKDQRPLGISKVLYDDTRFYDMFKKLSYNETPSIQALEQEIELLKNTEGSEALIRLALVKDLYKRMKNVNRKNVKLRPLKKDNSGKQHTRSLNRHPNDNYRV